MELSFRLLKIISMIEHCKCLADIGTDHAYIPISLIKNKKCLRAIASDINKGPLEKAINNIAMENLTKSIEARLGGGFSVLKPCEADVAVIAGMGGNLIRDIIEQDLEVFKSLKYCIFQPVQNPEVLREYIYAKGFDILDEELVIEENKFYEIIKASYNNRIRPMDDIYYEIGEKLIEKNHPLLEKFLLCKINKYISIEKKLNYNSINSQNRQIEITNKIHKLKGLMDL